MVVDVDLQRMCWICHMTDVDRGDLDWVSPCKCSGSTKWVHQRCLLRWLNDENGCREDRSSCPNGCGFQYIISEPAASVIVQAGTLVNRAVDMCTPVVAVMGTVAGAWAGLACYGAATVAVVCGKPGVDFLKRMDTPRLFAWLPMIPLGLFALRLKGAVDVQIRVQHTGQRDGEHVRDGQDHADAAANDAMEHRAAVEVAMRFDSDTSSESGDDDSDLDLLEDDDAFYHVENPSGPQSLSRLAVGGLLAPYMSYAMGLLCFGHIRDIPQLDRSVYGGILYFFFKSILQKFFRYQKRAHVEQRRVLDYVAIR
eukprot:m.176872 g.176872  ORF g.176872 m.176872 type:complete len:311 (-) comp18363_c0_seq36:6869-7801(-)